jgi:hypothetical protein
MLLVPAKLNQYVDEVAELGLRGYLPPLNEMVAKVHEIVRDPVAEGRHISVPMDILFTDLEGDAMECFVLVREKTNESGQVDLRKKSLLIRYFLKFAFSAYSPEHLKVRFAFYLDPVATFNKLRGPGDLFHKEEIVSFQRFWELVTGRTTGFETVYKARDTAAQHLSERGLMQSIAEHFSLGNDPLDGPPRAGAKPRNQLR